MPPAVYEGYAPVVYALKEDMTYKTKSWGEIKNKKSSIERELNILRNKNKEYEELLREVLWKTDANMSDLGDRIREAIK